jgi:hypothetical protein
MAQLTIFVLLVAVHSLLVTKTYRAATYLPQDGVAYTTGNLPFGVFLANLTTSGNTDMVAVNIGASTISVLIGNGDGTFQTKADYATGGSPRLAAIADFNGVLLLSV